MNKVDDKDITIQCNVMAALHPCEVFRSALFARDSEFNARQSNERVFV